MIKLLCIGINCSQLYGVTYMMKNKRTKLISLLLVVLFTIPVFCSCSKKEKVEININVPVLEMSSEIYPECKYTKDFITIAWDEFAKQYSKYEVSLTDGIVHEFEQTDYQANIPDRYGKENATDLTFGGYFMIGSYINDGYVFSLDDILTDKLTYQFTSQTWDQSKGSNGKTYMLPFYSLQNILCFNKDIFNECGLSEFTKEDGIQGWDLDTWEKVLSTLKEKMPEGSYPLMMYAKNNQGDTHTMVQLRCKGSEFFDKDKLFNLNSKEGIEGLQWIKDNYDKGYYPENCEDMEIKDCQELFTSGKLGLYVYNTALTEIFNGMNLGYVNFPSSDSHGASSNWITGFMGFDNGDPKKIEVIKDFLKYIYSSNELMDYSTGGDPCSRIVIDRNVDKMEWGYNLLLNEDYSVEFTGNNPNWPSVREAFYPHIHALLTGEESAEDAAKGIDSDCNKAIENSERRLHE